MTSPIPDQRRRDDLGVRKTGGTWRARDHGAVETRLTVELVPSTCWYTNVRSHVPKTVWDRLRRQVAAAAGDRCEMAWHS